MFNKRVQTLQKGPAAREDNTPVHDIGRQLRGGIFQCHLDRIHDNGDRFAYRVAYLVLKDGYRLGYSRNKVPALNVHGPVFIIYLEGYVVEAENFESIHNHSAYAQIEKGGQTQR